MTSPKDGAGARKDTGPKPAPLSPHATSECAASNPQISPESKPLTDARTHLLGLDPDRVLLAAGVIYGMGKPNPEQLDEGDRKLLMQAGQFLYALQDFLKGEREK